MAILHYQPPMDPYISIVYQDDAFVILNKPSELLTVPGKPSDHKDCLETRVQTVFPTATIVHRLDMATSGLLIMALTKAAHREISRQFQQRETQKRYIARVFGHIKDDEGSIELPLICDWPNRPKQIVDIENGKAALTHYQVLNRDDNQSRVLLKPVTGRSHQLRVHMLSLGHPILGDRLYAHTEALAMADRLQLHAQWIAFKHPDNGKKVQFNVDCPF
ncbi:MAG: tRNA pseudouridine32 synthase/23S rRNA pseudouridine746 synthase [Alteromonadaceae bacterium]|jgi:tRNA pseudouridine32 synthase/23S rRNA pseudouridine746 synthase